MEELLSLPPWQALYRIMVWYFGWMIPAILYLVGIVKVWRYSRRVKWFGKQRFILLAIDIPENNEQSPKAVENLFTYLAGAHKNINLIEQWWEGVFQLGFSMEVVGIDGYIQFLIHAPAQFKNLVETAVYAQYPDAEITEVQDYTTDAPTRFPNEEYDCWGAEFIPSQNHMLPIKLYKEFEHIFGRPETTYRDPMASLMDLMSSLQPGEQIWWQILVDPTGFGWMDEGYEQINKICGIKKKAKESLIIKAFSKLGDLSEHIIPIWGDIVPKKDAESEYNSMKLTPGQKKQVEAIQEKIAKMGFEVKIRMVYIAKKDVINKPKVANGFVGFIKQFTSNDLNGLKPDMEMTATSAAYFQAEKRMDIRKGKIVRAFKNRDDVAGRKMFIMNSEELATLWHFPIDAVVKAPLVQRASAKRAEAPMALPLGEQMVDLQSVEPIFQKGYQVSEQQNEQVEEDFEPWGEEGDAPPDNLPVV